MTDLLRLLSLRELPKQRCSPIDAPTLVQAAQIVDQVRTGGIAALQQLAIEFGDRRVDEPLILTKEDMQRAASELPKSDMELLTRTADRIRLFAQAQRDALAPLVRNVPGGEAGHEFAPVRQAGCYAPGGRFPLPSTVLMTVAVAKVAGVRHVIVASPRPPNIMLATALVAGADAFLAVGGAQAIAALAHGVGIESPCDVVVGPGNRWVTAAKQLVSGTVRIDMLAGPSELVVLADSTSNPALVAADLLAQAEHDPDAVPILVSTSRELIREVESQLHLQLEDLPTAENARAALNNGFALLVPDLESAVEACNQLAPEHLHIAVQDFRSLLPVLHDYGALFLGQRSAEVFGDYGIGPNHVLPTGGTARSMGGLSVLTFLRQRTWIRMDEVDDPAHTLGVVREMIHDVASLARLEGLEAHARSAERRLENR